MINIRYASIRSMDISNGEGVGIALFVQGCHFHCKNCFNQNTWDFNGGNVWDEQNENELMNLLNRPYISRISILGGEPLEKENIDGVLHIIKQIHLKFPEKKIWLYTGYKWEDIFIEKEKEPIKNSIDFLIMSKRQSAIRQCNVLIDGVFIDSLKDISLKWRGSTNQRVIDVQESIKKEKIVLWKNS